MKKGCTFGAIPVAAACTARGVAQTSEFLRCDLHGFGLDTVVVHHLLAQLGVAAQDDPLDILPLARILVNEVDGGDGVLILTDILGATPANLTLKLLDPGRIEGVDRVSYPALMAERLPATDVTPFWRALAGWLMA